jgi:anti-anti-sigma regulatory factor
VLWLAGDADVVTVGELALALGVAEESLGGALVTAGVREVDLSETTFMDSSALALIVALAPRLRPERLRVRGAHGSPLSVLRLTGVDSVLDLRDTGED